MVQARMLSFAGTALVSAAQVLLLLLEVSKRSRTQYNVTYEHKFRALRYARTLVYAVLAACQVGDHQEQIARAMSSQTLEPVARFRSLTVYLYWLHL